MVIECRYYVNYYVCYLLFIFLGCVYWLEFVLVEGRFVGYVLYIIKVLNMDKLRINLVVSRVKVLIWEN